MRKEDQVPAIVYARHIDTPIMISCRRQDFVKLYRQTWRSTPITLKWDNIDEMVLVQDIQIDPVTNFVLHIDFLGIKKGEKVATDVPLVLEWLAPITKTWEARIQQVKDTLHIQAIPKDLPQEILIDITGLENVTDAIFVRDLVIPSGVEVLDDEDLSVVTVVDMSWVEEEAEETIWAEVTEGGDAAATNAEWWEEKTE